MNNKTASKEKYRVNRPLTILLVDVQDTRDVVRAMLQRLGHEVIEAANGKEAVGTTIDPTPDLILMDLSMPEVDGLLATQALRRISWSKRLPVVAMTAFPENLSREKALAAGCDAYLQKPFTVEDLSAVLRNLGL